MDGLQKNYNYIIAVTVVVIIILGLLWYFFIFLSKADPQSILDQMRNLSLQSVAISDK